MGYYDFLLIAPANANTVAKLVYGIADTLVTNAVSQTAKGKTPIFIMPVDLKRGSVKTAAPNGRAFELTMREVDVTNSERLAFRIEKPTEDIVKKFMERPKKSKKH